MNSTHIRVVISCYGVPGFLRNYPIWRQPRRGVGLLMMRAPGTPRIVLRQPSRRAIGNFGNPAAYPEGNKVSQS